MKDCGIACLLMIIKYYHGYVSLERLRELTRTSKNGTTAYHIVETAKTLGFTAYGIKAELDYKSNIILPAIAHLEIKSGVFHYVVIYKIDYAHEIITLADPSDAIKKISFDDFYLLWHNIILIMYPSTQIPILDERVSLFTFLGKIVSKQKVLLTKIFFFSIIYGLVSIVSSYYFNFIMDAVNTNDGKKVLYIIFYFITTLYLLKHITDYIRNRLFILLNEKIAFIITSNFFRRLINLPYNYYSNRTTGEVISKINDLVYIEEFISKICLFFAFDFIILILSTIVLFLINTTLFLISIMIVIIDLLIVYIFFKYLKKGSYTYQVKKASVIHDMTEVLSAYESVKGVHLEDNLFKKFTYKYLDLVNASINYQSLINKYNLLKNINNDFLLGLAILIGSLLIVEREFTIVNLLAFQTITLYFINAITNLINLLTSYPKSLTAFIRISFLFTNNYKEGLLDNEITGHIKITNLTYSYDDITILLKDITLNIKAGEKILILGNSGSGKSTLLKILMKYYNISNDQVYIDGVDIVNYKQKNINKGITYISQNGQLFNDSLYNNLVVGRNIEAKKLTHILKLCHIDEIMYKHKLGLRTIIEENGFNLSGGERQRIILARALINDFKILLIDEGMNQMDNRLEYEILRLLFWEYQNKTIIVVSHNRLQFHLFDQVLEIVKGKIKTNE